MLAEVSVAFVIVAICVVIHTSVLLVFAKWMLGHLAIIESRRRLTHHAALLILVFFIVIVLHLLETALWASFYYWQSLFPDFETSLYFSLTSYTTIGFGDVVLPQKWRLLGAMEGISGVLLCGLSTAFIFAVVNLLFRMRTGLANDTRRS
jgi:voltage-gated potassium channel Kch